MEVCLAIPMRIKTIDAEGLSVCCEARGVERQAGLFMVETEDLCVGDYVMISLGQVVQKVSEDEARLAWAHYDEIFSVLDAREPPETKA